MERRDKVRQVRDDVSGQLYLQGREEIVERTANVFGNSRFKPLARTSDKVICVEAEVMHSFSDTADDDVSDYSDVYMFRILSWQIGAESAAATVLMSWQDFNGDDVPGAQYGWDELLQEAVSRIRNMRFERKAFESIWVGGPADGTTA